MNPPVTIASARPDELGPALGLLFHHLPDEERARRSHAALDMVRTGELDPTGVLLARSGGILRGVLVCQIVPGASALLWPPRVTGESLEIADALVTSACHWLRREGAKLAHALVTDAEMEQASPLLRNGFTHVTGLWYLRHRLEELPPFAPALDYVTYAAAERAVFQRTLLASYEGTLDCPELNHVRTAEEILAGHRAQGVHDPRRWWLVRDGEKPVGVLLLTDVPALGGWDLSYLGVIPEVRRRGVGRKLASKALWEARRGRAPQLSLAVDERNQPAWELYIGLGFEPFDKREVLLALFS